MNKPTPEYSMELLSCIPSRPDYDTSKKCINAIRDDFDESTTLKTLLSRFSDESPNKHLEKIKYWLKNITFAPLAFLAKQYGYAPVKETSFRLNYSSRLKVLSDRIKQSKNSIQKRMCSQADIDAATNRFDNENKNGGENEI